MEKWNEISYNLSEKKNISEDKFELIVIQILGTLGWKKYAKSLEVQPVYKTYANKSIRMDILVKQNNQNVFIIEVKKPDLPITLDFSNQLKSYMRFLKLDFGLLIGEKIQIYYDGNEFNNKGFILLEEIEYRKDNPKGLEFVQLFQKNNFNENNLKGFAQKKLVKINNKRVERELKEELLSSNQNTLIKELLKSNLLKKYDKSIIDNVFETLKIEIKETNNIKETIKQEIKRSINNSNETNQLSTKTRIKKKKALEILNMHSLEINSRDVCFSNMVKPHNNWWIDFNPNNFEKKFYIVLNDFKEKTLFVFEIPANTFYPPEKYFYFREDKGRYSIGVLGVDKKDFKDTKNSKNPVYFKRFLKHEIEYKEIKNIPNNETKKAIYEAHNSKDLKPIEDLDKYFESL